MTSRVVFFIFLIVSYSIAFCQVVDTTSVEVEEQIENITETSEAEIDFTEFTELLEKLSKNPINLNTATYEELQQLPFLNSNQIYNLLLHRKLNGDLLSIYELQSIELFDLETIFRILPYVYVKEKVEKRQVNFKEIFTNGKNQIFLRHSRILQEQKGFSDISEEELAKNPNARYAGSPDKIYLRYRFTYYNSLSFGVTGEKDAGEQFFKGNQKSGFDFYSAHFWMKNIGFLSTLAIGDYNLSFGQGLGIWTGLSFGKSSEIASMKKNGMGITPYTSTDENRYLRGAAFSYKLKKFELFGFYSNKNIDANLQITKDSLDNEEYYISSLVTSGYHRTPSEVEKKQTLNEQLFGGRLEFKSFSFKSGVMFHKILYEHPINRALKPYSQFEFNGKELGVLSADYNYLKRNLNFFGEISISDNGAMATIQGIYLTVAPGLTIATSYRNFQPKYQSIYSNAFSEGSKISNEQGLFYGIEARLNSKLTLHAYSDMFKHEWLKYRVDAPSNGYDVLGQLNYKYSKQANFYFRYRYRIKPLNYAEAYKNVVLQTEKMNYRLHGQYAVSPSVTFKSRVEVINYSTKEATRYGYLAYHDIAYSPKSKPWALTCRYALFDTETYDERIYAYENDVLYAYSIPSYFYRGSRFYVLIKYSITKNIDFWLRYAQTFYNNRKIIGSGLDEIKGQTKSEIKTQIRIKF